MFTPLGPIPGVHALFFSTKLIFPFSVFYIELHIIMMYVLNLPHFSVFISILGGYATTVSLISSYSDSLTL